MERKRAEWSGEKDGRRDGARLMKWMRHRRIHTQTHTQSLQPNQQRHSRGLRNSGISRGCFLTTVLMMGESSALLSITGQHLICSGSKTTGKVVQRISCYTRTSFSFGTFLIFLSSPRESMSRIYPSDVRTANNRFTSLFFGSCEVSGGSRSTDPTSEIEGTREGGRGGISE